MTESLKKKFEELNMTRDEIERFSEAMKKEEFRKLLCEYAEEISDPKNREIYEREISQLEAERGSDVTFIHPKPGFCVKTTQNGDKKCFVNISKNEHLAKPTSSRQANGTQSGLMWQIPHTCSQPREDVDKSGKTPCVVYDVVFHPDAYRMGETNKRFQKLLIDSAIDTIQKNFSVQLDAVNATVLKHLNFKGHPTASVIRKPRNEADSRPVAEPSSNKQDATKEKKENVDEDPLTPLIDQIKKEYLDRQTKEAPAAKKPAQGPVKVQRTSSSSASDSDAVQNEDAKYTIPKYRILHRGKVDFEDYAAQMDNSDGVRRVNSTRPKELVVTIDLPLCKSAAGVNLDIFATSLSLESTEPSYKLDLKFPFPVRSNEGKAKFDKSKRVLSITLPVVPFVEDVDVMSSQIVSELPTATELDAANTSIVSNDGQNQSSSILMSPTSLSSSSSSLSNESITTEDNLSTLETETDQAAPPVAQPAAPVKHTLPKKILIKETKNYVNLKYFVPNYNRNSLRIKIDSESQLSLTCDSTSSGGYVQFYATHVHFYFIKSINDDYAKQEGNDTLPYSFIGTNLINMSYTMASDQDLKVNFVNDELFEIKIRKRLSQGFKSSEDEIEAKKVRVSVNKPEDDLFNENLNHGQLNGLMVLDLAQELNVDEDMMAEGDGAKSHAQKRASEQLNSMSKKDFILNFNKLVKQNADQDGDVDEDDVDDDDADEFADASEAEKVESPPSKEETKKMSNAQFAKFKELKEARKAQQHERMNGCELLSKTEKIDEVPENDESEESDEEKKYLASAEMNQKDADDSAHSKMSGRQHHSGSLSSSSTNFSNENHGLSSSLNGSSSFNKLKGILKKPRSMSESESGAPHLCHSMSNASTSSFDGSVPNSGSDENGDNLSGSKKCVSFNKQIIRNVFKPGSTIAGMKKPNSNKNSKKKNKRKRTISDPSHDASGSSFRTRSISESSDDSSSAFTNSCESLPEDVSKTTASSNDDVQLEPSPGNNQIQSTDGPSMKKKKKNKKKQGAGQQAVSAESKSQFDMETMLQWKNQGRLQSDEQVSSKPNCAIKFKNKLMNDLEE